MRRARGIRVDFLLVSLLFSSVVSTTARAQVPSDCYRVESIATPPGHAPEVSAIAFAADGRLYATLRLGTMWSLDPKTREWRLFASGLHWPLGILPGEKGELFVAQVPELTRIVDSDGDGTADLYETVCDRWGLGGNYHEFLAGPVRDADGNFYVGLGCASSGGKLRFPVRGGLHPKARTGKANGHHSPVPWRGWVVKIRPDGELEPVASGFRQPNGLTWNGTGDLFVVDNQGDWIGTSPLHHVTKGDFCGHPASLVWDEKIESNPKSLPIDTLRRMRKPAAVLFPQNDLSGSTTQPIFEDRDGKFGPYGGHLFVAEWAHQRVHRVTLEKIDGAYQGACYPFLDTRELRRGGNRLAWAPDGSLWVAQVSRLWGGTGEGLQRITWTGKTPMDILEMRLRPEGFEIEFTRPVDRVSATRLEAYSLQRYRYLYHAKYGSPKVDVEPVEITAVSVSPDGRTATLRVEKLVTGFIYDLRPKGLRARDGTPLATRLAAYTLNRLKR